MNIVTNTVHELASTYCHYITMRLHFRAEVLVDSETESRESLTNQLCLKQPTELDL
jgi:hypothetical protein